MLNPLKIPVKKQNEYSIHGDANLHPIVITEITCVQLDCSPFLVIFLFSVVLFSDAFPSRRIIRQHVNNKPNRHSIITDNPLLLLAIRLLFELDVVITFTSTCPCLCGFLLAF